MADKLKDRIDVEHVEMVTRILDLLIDYRDAPHAMVALEDAYVACNGALSIGLSVRHAAAFSRRAIEEIRAAQNESQDGSVGADGDALRSNKAETPISRGVAGRRNTQVDGSEPSRCH